MAKWKLAVLVVLGAGAEAHELQPQADGCAVLEQVIYDEVTAASWGVTGTDTSLVSFEEPIVVVCSHTTRTATKAFATAMQMMGHDDTWLVSSAWIAVSRALKLAMPEGTASDRSIFNRDSLRRAVRSAVRNRQAVAWSGDGRRMFDTP